MMKNIIFFILWILCVSGNPLSGIRWSKWLYNFNSVSEISEGKACAIINQTKLKEKLPEKRQNRTMLPVLPPHKDTCYLIEFVSDNSISCEQTVPIVKQLETTLKVKVRQINVSRHPAFREMYLCVGGGACKLFPYFYNRRTGQTSCGRITYENLEALAVGRENGGFVSELAPDPEFNRRRRGGVSEEWLHERRGYRTFGWMDYLKEKYHKAKHAPPIKKESWREKAKSMLGF